MNYIAKNCEFLRFDLKFLSKLEVLCLINTFICLINTLIYFILLALKHSKLEINAEATWELQNYEGFGTGQLQMTVTPDHITFLPRIW